MGKKIKKKTNKTILGRITRTKNGKGKLRRRKGGQAHFNARANSKVKHAKRNDADVSRTIERSIERAI